MAMVFISHDLSVVRGVSDDALIIEEGMVRELGATEDVFTAPRSTYGRALLASVPDLGPADYPLGRPPPPAV